MSTRAAYAFGLLVSGGLLAFAYYLQYVEHQEPCPLCILQRVAFIAMMVLFAAAALHGPRRRAAWVYSGLLFAVGAAGAGIAGRQIWLQHLPADKVPACGPGLEFMLERFPLREALQKIFAGSGECAEVSWRFLGLSIAEWSLLWLVVLSAYAIYVAAQTPQADARRDAPRRPSGR